jgi:superfamily II DNA or RNA helicase
MPTPVSSSKQLYPYQQRDIETIFDRLENHPGNYRVLYQLPTGGGKTVVFSEITRRYIEKYGRKVAVLTHRKELSRQTARTLKSAGVKSLIINSTTKTVRDKNSDCIVAMVETLKNRVRDKKVRTSDIALVIIDEAHHNSFRKLLGNFPNAFVIGVTATPLSSDASLPLYKSYDELITGENITSLIDQGFLAKPKSIAYEVELASLAKGMNGDYTISSSDALYSSPALLGLLKEAYEKHALNKKTLIFNAGISTSRKVGELFLSAGYAIRHLDNKTPAAEREEILDWFKKTKGAILTSVSILTTGFDEPSVQTVILNRATTSLTLYHQMVGRGSRKLPNKKTFTILDLGNNTNRFGEWSEPVDWKYVFEKPEEYIDQLHVAATSAHGSMSAELRARFPNSLEVGFDIWEAFKQATENGKPHKTVIKDAVRQHAQICLENSDTISEALKLAADLHPEVQKRVKEYAKCLEKSTKNYRDWLAEDYNRRLEGMIKRMFDKVKVSRELAN